MGAIGTPPPARQSDSSLAPSPRLDIFIASSGAKLGTAHRSSAAQKLVAGGRHHHRRAANPQSYRAFIPRLSRHGRRNQSTNTQRVWWRGREGRRERGITMQEREQSFEKNLLTKQEGSCRGTHVVFEARPKCGVYTTITVVDAHLPKDPLPVQRQFISCESTKISSEQIFPLLERARHRGAHGDCGGCRWWLLHCDQRRRRAAHKSGRESLHSFWSKGKIGERGSEGRGTSGKGQGEWRRTNGRTTVRRWKGGE